MRSMTRTITRSITYLSKHGVALLYIGLGTTPAVFMAMLLWEIPQSLNLWPATAITAAIPLAGVWMLVRGLWRDWKARGSDAG